MNELKVIGICGKAFAGKTTSANYLVEKYCFKKTAFAKLLKETALKLYPWLTEEQIYGSMKEVVDTKLGITPRRMLQLLGTEVGRLIWEDTWVDGVKRDIHELKKNTNILIQSMMSRDLDPEDNSFFGITVDDVRFPNEVDAIKDVGGEVWVVVRGESGTNRGVPGHESEAYAEEFEKIADHVLINDGDFDNLYGQISNILQRVDKI